MAILVVEQNVGRAPNHFFLLGDGVGGRGVQRERRNYKQAFHFRFPITLVALTLKTNGGSAQRQCEAPARQSECNHGRPRPSLLPLPNTLASHLLLNLPPAVV